ncbi:Protein ssh4 [Coemansia sp. RSA 1822]|nr:Protein ssh4 [Coemansia sp. RSA 638]KAJ2120862.1 Protein ssh4 [Coemansia sp. RSA 720]KAJ2540088.1 Protein ssh4 [Coemansia sp. RSA 1853]KAJ2560570.1 Protein ssh4 [Coemansia sp. RSA 1822]
MTRASNWSGALATCLLCMRTASALPHIGDTSKLGWNMERPVMEDDSDDALVIMLILISAIFGTMLGIAAVFLVLYALVQVVQRVRRFVFRLDDDGMSERMRNQLLPDEDSRQSYELARAFERQYPYGSVDTQLTPEQQSLIREKGVDAWEFDVNLDVNAMQQSKTEVLFMGGDNCVQTNLPLPKSNSVYYFEVKLVEKPADVSLWIGLATKPFPAWRMVGWNKFSAGYCTNSGSVHQNSPFRGSRIGEPLLSGDILGIGYQPRSGVMWFTRNGRRYKEIVSGMLYDLFPTISADGPCSFSANFGQRGFVFIEANVKRWGLGPVEGTQQPPPVYGANQNTTLLETAESESTTPDSDDDSSIQPAPEDTVILIDGHSANERQHERRQRTRSGRRSASHRPPLYQKEDPIAAQLLEAGSTSLVPASYPSKQPESLEPTTSEPPPSS